MPNVLSPRDLVFRPDNMDETVATIYFLSKNKKNIIFTAVKNCSILQAVPLGQYNLVNSAPGILDIMVKPIPCTNRLDPFVNSTLHSLFYKCFISVF